MERLKKIIIQQDVLNVLLIVMRIVNLETHQMLEIIFLSHVLHLTILMKTSNKIFVSNVNIHFNFMFIRTVFMNFLLKILYLHKSTANFMRKIKRLFTKLLMKK
jgi:hypothetical protein